MQLASASVIAGVASLSRAFLFLGCRSVTVRGLDRFLRILYSEERRRSRTGLLTYANHISVLDEPLLWGSLPFTKSATQRLAESARSEQRRHAFRKQGQHDECRGSPFATLEPAENARWTLAASDIVYLNSALRSFFNCGQVLETFRGASPFQPALDTAISQLDQGRWVHIFPEGYVNLSLTTDLRRFKWGISRMAMEADRAPLCVPIWITGFDAIMPEPRAKPRWLPRLGASVSITFGRPVSRTAMRAVLHSSSRCIGAVPSTMGNLASSTSSILQEEAEAARREREEAYWAEAWEPDSALLGEAEDWEIASGYASSAASDVRAMAAAAIASASSPQSQDFSKPPPKSHFPPIAAHKPPPGGWPVNAPGSRAARAFELEEAHPERAQIRSAFAAMLRDEMGRLGLCVRKAMGDGEGEGRLAHTIMEGSS